MKTQTEQLMDQIIADNPKENKNILAEIRAEKAFGRQLKEIRLKANIDQKTLAKKTRMRQADISRIENGLTNPTIQTVSKLLKALNKKIEIVDIK
ncbi:MAG: helix-turn-helix transcriptional regulator [Erysipelothrix sp.]|jgi:ribosome-binding protein aMBF1 (putative translation factor)|nr:helix-turn-helix transcriptional regulator [Erysipelothrix sp.]